MGTGTIMLVPSDFDLGIPHVELNRQEVIPKTYPSSLQSDVCKPCPWDALGCKSMQQKGMTNEHRCTPWLAQQLRPDRYPETVKQGSKTQNRPATTASACTRKVIVL